MSLYTASLNSGSNGNCYYIGNGQEAILVDAGISCRETERRMSRLGLDIRKVAAIFISHEHSDHIRGLAVLSRKYKIPVYVTEATHVSGRLWLDPDNVQRFGAHETIRIGNLSVVPFPKSHDAAEPFSFVVKSESACVGVLTDIGHVCDNVIRYFKQCHAVFLESNYDEAMLVSGNYPVHLKRRISSNKGHLSNMQALELFLEHRAPFLSHVFLSHLSKENNTPQIAAAAFEKHRGHTQVVVAPRHQETPVFHIAANHRGAITQQVQVQPVQMALFG